MHHVVRSSRTLARSRTLAGAHRAARRAGNVGGVVELNRVAGDSEKIAEIEGYASKYMDLLGASGMAHPRIVLRSNLGSKWLARDLWTTSAPETSTIEVQREVLRDPRTLERVIAHEVIHHVDFVRNGCEQVKLKWLRRYDGHGEVFRSLAAMINASMGACFVTEMSDQEYVGEAVCKSYLVMIMPVGAKLGYAWTSRLSSQGSEWLQRKIAEGARAAYSTDPRWTHGAKIQRWGGVSVPKTEEDQARLRELYDRAQMRASA